MKLSRRQLASVIVAHQGTRLEKQAVKSTAAYLVAEGRTRELELLIREIEQVASEQGHTTVRVSSANSLSSQLLQDITKLVSKFENSNSVEIIESIDTSLLGGVVINTPEREVDLSVKGRLQRMKG